jgi:uncharacterized membrane protein YraQ (UPF0718 family)
VLLHYITEVIPSLILGFFISGLIHEFIPQKWVEKYLGAKGILPILWATVVGTFLPVCCWGSLPIALSFYKKGSGLGPVLAFLVATPATSISALILSYKMLGPVFTIYIFFSVIIMGLVIGYFGNHFKYTPKAISKNTCPHCDEELVSCKCPPGILEKVKDIFKYAFIEMPKDIGFEIAIGLILATVISAFVPVGNMINTYLSGVWAYPISLFVGLVMYFCSTASVPLIHALIEQGMNVGAAFVLLVVGPVTSYGTILVLRKEFGMRILLYFVISISILGIILGVIYEKIAF